MKFFIVNEYDWVLRKYPHAINWESPHYVRVLLSGKSFATTLAEMERDNETEAYALLKEYEDHNGKVEIWRMISVVEFKHRYCLEKNAMPSGDSYERNLRWNR